jgi:phosphopantothenoylcysteine synthetase/decarboxylase
VGDGYCYEGPHIPNKSIAKKTLKEIILDNGGDYESSELSDDDDDDEDDSDDDKDCSD